MKVLLNSPGFSYDVHSLVKAFFPDEDVKIEATGKTDEQSGYLSVYVFPEDICPDRLFSGCVRVSAGRADNRSDVTRQYRDLERTEIKSFLKRILYETLFHITGTALPWGTMTGIRPVKVPMKLLRQGADDGAIYDHMKSVYLCSDEKIALATGIAHREKRIIDSLPDDGFSLYIGIPFCPTTCMYCSFTSYPIASWAERTDEYLRALKRELDHFCAFYDGRKPDSIYIGGGTPTTLSPDQLTDLIGYVRQRFDLSGLREFTVEAGRPDSITREKLEALISSGVDRISVNPQTMNEGTLKLIGRRHTVEDVYKAYETARSVGFSNINMDLILGLPGEDEGDVANTFERIKELSPDSLTVHSLAVKRASNIHEYIKEHGRSHDASAMMEIAGQCAKSLGLVPYYLYRQKNMSGNLENVGYSREENPGIYNIVIMEEISDIAAAGAGTISKRILDGGRIERCDNVKDVALYIDRIDEMIEKKERLWHLQKNR